MRRFWRPLRAGSLEYKEYEPLFRFVEPKEKCWYVTCDGYVTLTDGTGVVHIAPAFGEDDAKVGRKYGLPFVQLVDGKGEMTKETALARASLCKDADTPRCWKNLDGAGPALRRAQVRAQLSSLLAVRYPVDLLRPGIAGLSR